MKFERKSEIRFGGRGFSRKIHLLKTLKVQPIYTPCREAKFKKAAQGTRFDSFYKKSLSAFSHRKLKVAQI